MELKYPKVSSGLKLMYASWWLALLSGIASFIVGIISAVTFTEEGVFVTLLSAVAEMVVYALQVAGLYQAGKEEKRYKKSLFYVGNRTDYCGSAYCIGIYKILFTNYVGWSDWRSDLCCVGTIAVMPVC